MVALTRIKNNQITDSTIVANSKIQNYTVTSQKIAKILRENFERETENIIDEYQS